MRFFLPFDRFKWEFWQKYEQISLNLARKWTLPYINKCTNLQPVRTSNLSLYQLLAPSRNHHPAESHPSFASYNLLQLPLVHFFLMKTISAASFRICHVCVKARNKTKSTPSFPNELRNGLDKPDHFGTKRTAFIKITNRTPAPLPSPPHPRKQTGPWKRQPVPCFGHIGSPGVIVN